MSNSERFRPYVAVFLVLIRDDKILLLRRFNTGYQDGNYSLVAGHLDGGETSKESIIREAREEAGIDINPEDIEVTYINHRLSPDREYFDIYLRAEKYTGVITNMEPDKCDQLEWFYLHDLPSNMLPDVRHALENILQKKHYGEFGWESR